MSEKWYPVIDYSLCTECGDCVAKCPHGVYDTTKAPVPVVKNPGTCIDHCHGCGSRCPAGAITYVGDDTGWQPSAGGQDEEAACCSCGCSAAPEKKVLVDYLYLDLKTCDRCIGTDGILDEVMMALTPALQMAGYEVKYRKINVDTEKLARHYRFVSSPTVRVNGKDICSSVRENSCGCCSEISGTDVDCRVFEFEGKTYEVPPKEMLAEEILKTLFRQPEADCSCGGYDLPKNLQIFFEGKKNMSKCTCGNCG